MNQRKESENNDAFNQYFNCRWSVPDQQLHQYLFLVLVILWCRFEFPEQTCILKKDFKSEVYFYVSLEINGDLSLAESNELG